MCVQLHVLAISYLPNVGRLYMHSLEVDFRLV